MKRLFALFLIIALLSGCGRLSMPEGETLTFTDGTGAEVVCPLHPARVAVLFSSFAEIWTLAGGEVAVTVGETVERGFAAEDAVLVDDGAGHSTIDTERLIAARPDFVIGTADYPVQTEAVELCREAGIPGALFTEETAEDYLAILRVCCDLTENEEAYEKYGTDVLRETEKLVQEAENGTKNRVLLLRAGSSARSVKAKASDDLTAGIMLRMLGQENIADSAPVLLDGLSTETILTEDPDWILVVPMGEEKASEEYVSAMLREPGWSSLTCVREGRVSFLPKEYFHFKPNQRWAEGLSWLWELLSTE